MAKELNVVVKAVTVRNNTRNIYVANGYIYNIVGVGATAGAQLTPIDEATDVELYNALGPDNNNIPLAASLGQMADFTQFGEEEKYLLTSPKEVSAEEPVTSNPWVNSLDEEVQNQNCENKSFDPTTYKVDNNYFDSAVDFLTRLSGEDFLELVSYAKSHNNTFVHCVKEVAECVNADDTYCTAIIKLSRHLGEEVEKKAFNLLAEAEKDEYDFVQFWEALQTINYFCN